MLNYHAYLKVGDDLAREADIDAINDATAMLEAGRMFADAECDALEVWHGTRLIGKLGLNQPAA